MKKIISIRFAFILASGVYLYSGSMFAQIGKVGINTTLPQAMLHVKDSSVLFSGANSLPSPAGPTPASGAGVRMMWYPDKAAFRAGYVSSTHWDQDSIGIHSVAIGLNTKARGNYSTAFGAGTTARGSISTAFGNGSVASGSNSTAMGSITLASGSGSTAMGSGTDATGTSSLSMGSFTIARGTGSTSMGIQTIARSYASVAIGRFNDTTATSTTGWISTDPIFTVGNGAGHTDRSNAFYVRKDGRVGIGTSTPANILDVEGGIAIGSSFSGAFAAPPQGAIIQGNVGIGTSEPVRRLHVQYGLSGAPAQTLALAVLESSSDTYLNILTPEDEESGILFALPGSSSDGGIIYNNLSAPRSLLFRTNGNLNRMIISDDGKVAIGTNFTTELLRVGTNTDDGIQIGSFEILRDAGASSLNLNANFLPATDNLYDVGSPSFRWDDVWATNGGNTNFRCTR